MDIAVNKSIFIAPPSLLSRNISLYALVDTYDKWRGWSDVLTTQLVIDEGSMTIAAVKAWNVSTHGEISYCLQSNTKRSMINTRRYDADGK